jgi:hypothetical protein
MIKAQTNVIGKPYFMSVKKDNIQLILLVYFLGTSISEVSLKCNLLSCDLKPYIPINSHENFSLYLKKIGCRHLLIQVIVVCVVCLINIYKVKHGYSFV